ncbi:MAG: 50S ribosomal protein L13, partial [Odoribacter sp.]|nr:50S ribosomal protein L13 [Odoribacter sp.]
MDQISYKTTYVNNATVKKEWVLIDAENEVFGRLAAKVAKLLRG